MNSIQYFSKDVSNFFPEEFSMDILLLCISKFKELEIYLELEKHLGKSVKHFDEISEKEWKNISEFDNISLKFLEKFEGKIDWNRFFIYNKHYEQILRRFSDKINESYIILDHWDYISSYETSEKYYSEEFIRDYHEKFNWFELITNRLLSDSLLEEFIDKFDDDDKELWLIISKYQHPSEEFLLKYFDKFEWDSMLQNRYADYIFMIEDNKEETPNACPGVLRLTREFYEFVFEKFYGKKPKNNVFD
jgi:hypothetical protein